MPLDYANYPDSWKIIRKGVLQRAQWRCENCGAENYEPHPDTGSRAVLTVSHTDHNILNNEPTNLRALCQRCHPSSPRKRTSSPRKRGHDAREHAAHAAETHRLHKEMLHKLAGQLGIFE